MVMTMNHKKAAPLYVAGAGICWGIIGLFSRPLLTAGYSSLQVTASRCFVTAAALGAVLLLTDRKAFLIRIRDLWMFAGSGILSIVFFNICYFIAIEETTLSAAAVLLYTAPCFVVLLSALFFHEKITHRKLAALGAAFAGCVLTTGILSSGGLTISVTGVLAGIGSGFGYGLYSIFGHIALARYSTKTVTFYTFLIAALSLIPFCSPASLVEAVCVQPSLLLFILLLGIVATLLPFLLYTRGLAYMEAGKASVMAFIEPMVATAAGTAFLGEKMTLSGGLGIALIFCAVWLLNGSSKKENKKSEGK